MQESKQEVRKSSFLETKCIKSPEGLVTLNLKSPQTKSGLIGSSHSFSAF